MLDGAFALALGAGLVAAVNPCGFALLPAYLATLVRPDDGRAAAVGRALRSTAALTLGFVAVFGAFGLVVAPVASSVQRWLPVFTLVLGVVLAAAGVWVLTGRELPGLRLLRTGSGRPLTDRWWSVVGFGASYALASLTCTIAPFLAVVVTAFRAGSVAEGVALFATYAAGMALLVGTAAVVVAVAGAGVVSRARGAGPVLARVGGGILVVAGLYVAWYGFWELRVLHAGAGTDPVVEGAAAVQRWLASAAEGLGWVGLLVVLLVVLASVGGLTWWRRHRA
ncbi:MULTISPECIES: cytochrome c biogenesis CcdA family protein [unclassified Isoptericola]|uniref:cytochrome c biogenesis CcdA family protein n=1 Tax=unclassified Isoptericola TaxID=2623355 RepID=UPI0027126E0E|nr:MULTISPECIES: cytochrome c biogenesis CcdA family protein [unclassified Isoptericola]MDO8147000.1 cytochrome c biogenesis CcdA family protein [Isoptericola sp. b515]MDO8150685.1 cytochrome c biogenesis CcdA family protein [Isoptericola sp. b408]